nr:unnamed protein product [Callosobruchus analis]
MGVKRLPSYKDYWSVQNIHLNDNTLEPKKVDLKYDKLYKVRPMPDSLSETDVTFYKPSRCQAIDESMIRFKGRISFRQYSMPMKPIKRGYKMWRVVYDLTRDLVGKHREVYMDNFFNSVLLQFSLQKDNIYSCGTARKDRKWFPKDFVDDKNLKRGDFDWKVTETGILALKWKHNKAVHFLSNFHNPDDVESISRKQKDGSRIKYKCIKLVKDYNKHMGYVDRNDMYKSCYEINRKSKQWGHIIFWSFVDLTVVNAYIIFKEKSSTLGKTLSLKQFRIAVVNGLIGADPETPQRGRKFIEPVIRKYTYAHMPVHAPLLLLQGWIMPNPKQKLLI